MKKISIFLIIVIFFLPLSTFGADWYVGWTGDTGNNQTQKIPDDQEFHFKIGKFLCKVSKIDLHKFSDEIYEYRNSLCSISKNTTVSIRLDYNVQNKDFSDERTLFIDKDGKKFMAILIVGDKLH